MQHGRSSKYDSQDFIQSCSQSLTLAANDKNALNDPSFKHFFQREVAPYIAKLMLSDEEPLNESVSQSDALSNLHVFLGSKFKQLHSVCVA